MGSAPTKTVSFLLSYRKAWAYAIVFPATWTSAGKLLRSPSHGYGSQPSPWRTRSADIPATARNSRLREAAERLARLYEAMSAAEDAKKWRAEAAKYPEPTEVPAK
jgi:hypothetical protein